MLKDKLYFETSDAHLLCLNAKDGKLLWDIVLADSKLGYFATMAPLVIGNHIIAGVSGDSTDIRGILTSVDPDTGAVQWHWYTEPDPGQPGSETWPDADALLHGGGMTWMTGTYDPALNLVYWGTGNPNPVLVGEGREGDNLYTCSIVALHADSGKLAWYFQPSPHDVHDWDAVETPILFDGDFGGQQRQMLAQASRNGYFFVLDRKTGKHLLTAPFVETNWAKGINAAGQPVRDLDKDPAPDGRLVSPASNGATNWLSPSFDPQTGLVYVSARRQWSVFYKTSEGKAEGWGGRDRGLYSESVLVGIDYKTGEIRWKHEIGPGEGSAGLMNTAGNVLFTADTSGNLLGLSPSTGETLWHVNMGGRVANSPMTYQISGKQYLIFGCGDTLYAFTLPPERK
jgi:acido-empty-quinoprotein group A